MQAHTVHSWIQASGSLCQLVTCQSCWTLTCASWNRLPEHFRSSRHQRHRPVHDRSQKVCAIPSTTRWHGSKKAEGNPWLLPLARVRTNDGSVRSCLWQAQLHTKRFPVSCSIYDHSPLPLYSEHGYVFYLCLYKLELRLMDETALITPRKWESALKNSSGHLYSGTSSGYKKVKSSLDHGELFF